MALVTVARALLQKEQIVFIRVVIEYTLAWYHAFGAGMFAVLNETKPPTNVNRPGGLRPSD